MSPRGGRRPNQTGRPLRGAEPVTTRATVGLTASERAELTAALRPGESLAAMLRDGGLRLARERRFLCVWCGAKGYAPMRDHAATCAKRPIQQPPRARLVGEEGR